MRKGVILEINDLYLTLLTPEGEFLRARKLQQDYQVGEEIHFFPEMAAAKRKKFNLSFLTRHKARTIALTASLFLVLMGVLPVYQNSKVYAYMSIDVNPSVEMAVNEDLKVLRLKGYNEEGKEIVEAIASWKKKDAAAVAEMILDKMDENGYLEEKNNVVIATVHNGKVKKTIDQKLEQKIAAIEKATKEEHLELKVMHGTSEDRKNAKKQGLTTGLYKTKQTDKADHDKKPAPADKKEKPDAVKEETKKQFLHPEKKVPEGKVKKSLPKPPKNGPAKLEKPASKGKDGQIGKDGTKKPSAENPSLNKAKGNGESSGKDEDDAKSSPGLNGKQNKSKSQKYSNKKIASKQKNNEYTGRDRNSHKK